MDQLIVRAGASGVLQQLPVEVGQRLTPGTVLAKIAQPSKLKAELKVPETTAKDVLSRQKVEIDTRNGLIEGQCQPHRSRGREWDRNRRCSSRRRTASRCAPDLSVDGSIEIERLNDVVYVGRPVLASRTAQFRCSAWNRMAGKLSACQ